MKIAIEGCAHGELEKIYEMIKSLESKQNLKVDLLLCCGDFQSTRNLKDLQTMAVPKKYQDICTFYKYYSGELVAPMLTIFIGGNHEASNYLQELPYGGWVAPNIYYLGYAGVVRVNGIRIAGLSGIYKGNDYLRGRHEFPPYTEATRRSVYHVRQLEVFRLKQLSGKIDIILSHDWPRGIYNYGNKAQLLRFKPFLRDDIESEQLGSKPCEDLLRLLQPTMWFAAHLHCQFAAVVAHLNENDSDNSTDSTEGDRVTKFLALDKCLPKRRFLQILDIETDEYADDGNIKFEYDLEWLTILNLTNHLTNVKNSNYYLPGAGGRSGERYNFTPTPAELALIKEKFFNDLRIPTNFSRTADPYDPHKDSNNNYIPQPDAHINQQCTQFCDMLGIDDPLSLAMLISGQELNHSYSSIHNDSDTPLTDSSGLLLSNQSNCSISDFSDMSPTVQKSTVPKRILNLSLPKPGNESATGTTPPKGNLVESVQDPEFGPLKRRSGSIEAESKQSTDLTTGNESLVNVSNEESESDTPGFLSLVVEKSDLVGNPIKPNKEESIIIAPKPPIKKFKRRNQDIYSAGNDSEEN